MCQVRAVDGAAKGDDDDRARVMSSAKIKDMLLASARQNQEEDTNLQNDGSNVEKGRTNGTVTL